jgi:hypothetical protein
MTLLQLRSTLAAYLQKTVPDLMVNGVDLSLLALNNVRRMAEMLHDFEFSRKRVTVTLDGLDGGTLEDVIQAGSPTCEVKTVIECGIYDDNWNVHRSSDGFGVHREAKQIAWRLKISYGWRSHDHREGLRSAADCVLRK